MDLVSGGELLNRIRNSAALEEKDIRLILKCLLSGLDHMHENSIMHRDLKPENLLLKSKEGSFDILIADFGLATTFDDLSTILFKRCGTPGYVAPEILLYKV